MSDEHAQRKQPTANTTSIPQYDFDFSTSIDYDSLFRDVEEPIWSDWLNVDVFQDTLEVPRGSAQRPSSDGTTGGSIGQHTIDNTAVSAFTTMNGDQLQVESNILSPQNQVEATSSTLSAAQAANDVTTRSHGDASVDAQLFGDMFEVNRDDTNLFARQDACTCRNHLILVHSHLNASLQTLVTF